MVIPINKVCFSVSWLTSSVKDHLNNLEYRVMSTWLSYGKTGMFEHGVYRPKIAFHREHDDNPWDTISFAPNLSDEPKYYNLIQFLVGGLEHVLFSHILGIMIPTDFHIFQRGWNHQPDFMWHVRKICWETSQKGSVFFFSNGDWPRFFFGTLSPLLATRQGQGWRLGDPQAFPWLLSFVIDLRLYIITTTLWLWLT